jgi:hypothetical protein
MVKEMPLLMQLRNLVSVLLLHFGKKKETIDFYDEAIKLFPDKSPAYYRLNRID